jgi:excisionase family DNA binding protein
MDLRARKTPIPALVSTAGAARALECSESTVRRLADEGRLQAVRLDTGKRVIAVASVEALLAERRAGR